MYGVSTTVEGGSCELHSRADVAPTQFELPPYPVLALGPVLFSQGVVLIHGVTKLLH